MSSLTVKTSLVCLLFALVPHGADAQEKISDQALRQIGALYQEKASRSPAQRKISSSLLFEIKKARRDVTLEGLPELRSGIELGADGRVLVDMDAEVSDALLSRIDDLGGVIVNHFKRYHAIRAGLPLEAIEALAAEPAVRGIRPADRYMIHGNTTITEGDEAHQADLARTNFGVDGTGVQVGAMSDSVDELAALQAAGELPAVTVLVDQSGNPGTSEGTALLEIIHDMAPGADLFFATGLDSPAQMATNIEALQAAGCDVIVDDIGYFIEGVFQDDIIAQAVETVAALGVLYFSAAGNSGNLNDGTSGVFQGVYSGTALPAPLVGAGLSAHDFGGGDVFNTVTEVAPNDAPVFTLQWANPIGEAGTDYDLFLLNAAMTNVDLFSTDVQDGNDRPYEEIVSKDVDHTGNHLVVVKFSGDDLFFHLNTHRGRLEIATDGQIFGHPAAVNAFAVGAVQVPAGGGPFTGSESVETFSSDGPRRIFFEADGSPVTAASDGDDDNRQP